MIYEANNGPTNELSVKKILKALVLGKMFHCDKTNGINVIHENTYDMTKKESNGREFNNFFKFIFYSPFKKVFHNQALSKGSLTFFKLLYDLDVF